MTARRSARDQRTVKITAPEQAAGRSEYETDGLAVRLELPQFAESTMGTLPRLLADVVVENKRTAMAHIGARRSCIIDSQAGAQNLFLADRIVPGREWTRLGEVLPGFVTVNLMLPWWDHSAMSDGPPTGKQRLILAVNWEDGQQESVDLTFEVRAGASSATTPAPGASARQ